MRLRGRRFGPSGADRSGSGRSGAGPLLSVVVPAYQVEDYLDACLASVLAQRGRFELEVVVVDDGSTDGTAARAAAWAGRDPRVRVVRQDNAGLGAARNRGVAEARGELLAFADSDDLVPPGAYEALVRVLEHTGSVLAAGAVERFDETGRRWQTPLMAENHRVDRLAVGVEDVPLALADVFAWNKVYRRSFWDAEGLAFPVGVRYEDQPTLTRALVAAPSFDLVGTVVYGWRVRGDGSSISQQRASAADLADRFATKRDSSAVVEGRCSAAVLAVWFRRVLAVDLPEYLGRLEAVDEAWWRDLRAGVRSLWHEGTLLPWEVDLAPRWLLLLWLLDADRRDDALALLAHLAAHDGVLPRDAAGRAVHPFTGDPALPAALRGV